LRKAEAIINFGFVLAPVLFLLGVSHFVGLPIRELVLYSVSLSILAVGLLFAAKLPIFRVGNFFTLGPNALPKHSRPLYYLSYGALFMALCVWVALAITIALGASGV
jgi:hypothetical protein